MFTRCLQATGLLLFICYWTFAKVMVINGLTHVHAGRQGQLLKGKIQVKNVGATAEKILIYQNGLLQTCDEKNDFVPVEGQVRGLGKWIETNVDETVIQAGETYEIQYTINVPQDTSLSGSYWSLLMIEGAEPINKALNSQFTVGSKIRYAVQIIADIGTPENPKLNFEKVDLKQAESGNKAVRAKLKNLGKFMVVPKLTLEIYSKDGQKIKAFESTYQKIYPFTCKDFAIEISGLANGKYDAVLVADYGQDLFGTNLVIDIE